MSSHPRVWSLWDMLKAFESRHVFGSLTYLAQTEKLFRIGITAMCGHPKAKYTITASELEEIPKCLHNLGKAAEDYGIPGVATAVAAAKKEFDRVGPDQPLDINQLSALELTLGGLRSTYMNVIREVGLYVLTRGSADYYDGSRVGFGDEVDEAFPTSAQDVAEASKCRALERWTASVMHCMRALETPLVTLAKRVGADHTKENWHELLKGIEEQLKLRSKKVVGTDATQFDAEAAAHFRFIKNAWRNHAMHNRDHYGEEGAVIIYDNTAALMRHLASELKENP